MLLRRTMGWVCVALAAGLFIVGWWPFSFRPVNRVGWLPDRAGLHFAPDGVAYDPELLPATGIGNSSNQPTAFTVELWLQPEWQSGHDVFDILTIDDGHSPANLVLCQWLSELELRSRENESRRRYREVSGGAILPMQQERFITVTGDAAETIFYADGIPVARHARSMLPVGGLNGRLILGNSAEGKNSWTGQLFGLAVFNRALSADEVAQHQIAWTHNLAAHLTNQTGLAAFYLFDQRSGQWAEDRSPNRHRIFIPSHYEVLRKTVLVLAWDDFSRSLSGLDDIGINILGFMPFGFCLFCFRRMTVKEHSLKSILFAVAVGAVVSLVIELVQVWLPNRVSSSTDVMCNTLGTFLGGLLARFFVFRTPATEPQSDKSPD